LQWKTIERKRTKLQPVANNFVFIYSRFGWNNDWITASKRKTTWHCGFDSNTVYQHQGGFLARLWIDSSSSA